MPNMTAAPIKAPLIEGGALKGRGEYLRAQKTEMETFKCH